MLDSVNNVKQARKGFRPPSAMKEIKYFRKLGNFLDFFGNFLGGFFWRNFLEEFFVRNFLGGFLLGGFFCEEFL